LPSRDTRHALQRQQGMAHVIEDAEEEDEVERTDAFGRQFHHVDVQRLDARAIRAMREIESRFRSPSRSAPAEMVGCQDSLCAAAFRFEGVEAVPRADVQY